MHLEKQFIFYPQNISITFLCLPATSLFTMILEISFRQSGKREKKNTTNLKLDTYLTHRDLFDLSE